MTEDAFRKLALSLPDAVEASHMNHPDFRVRGKIFATIYRGMGMVKLTPDQQEMFVKTDPRPHPSRSALPAALGCSC